MKINAVFAVCVSCVLLAGCADFSELNKSILQNNVEMRKAFAEGMAACKDDAACKVGVTAAYFSSAGQQQVLRPQTALDWAAAMSPYANKVLELYRIHEGGAGNSGGGITINGSSGVSLAGVMSDINSSGGGSDGGDGSGGGSSLSISSSATYTNTNYSGNRNYTLGSDSGTVTDDGVADTDSTVPSL